MRNVDYKSITERNGQIGIGTKAPDAKLTVKGQIHTQEVMVDLEGAVAPDYVFEAYFEGESELNPSYKFPSLQEVGSYIEANHHLPGVPSADELDKTRNLSQENEFVIASKDRRVNAIYFRTAKRN